MPARLLLSPSETPKFILAAVRGSAQAGASASILVSKRPPPLLDHFPVTSIFLLIFSLTHLLIQLVKNPPAMHETPVGFLDPEDPLEKGYATHSSVLGLPLWLSG